MTVLLNVIVVIVDDDAWSFWRRCRCRWCYCGSKYDDYNERMLRCDQIFVAIAPGALLQQFLSLNVT